MRGQGALEYLIIISAVLGVTAVVIAFITGMFSTTNTANELAECRLAASQCLKDIILEFGGDCEYCETACVDMHGNDLLEGTAGCGLACLECKQGRTITPESAPSLGLAAYWKFDENGGSIITDDSGNEITGTIIGSPIWRTNCKSGTCLEFNGVSDYIDFGNPEELQITGDQTIIFWIKPNSTNRRTNPYAKSYGGEGTITLEPNTTVLEPNGPLSYYYGTCGNNCFPYQGFGVNPGAPLNVWTHFAIVRDLSDSKLYWYKNGILVREADAVYSPAAISTLNAYIAHGYTNNFNGSIDEFRIYNRALNPDEVLDNYNMLN